jgi:hypothetical protein
MHTYWVNEGKVAAGALRGSSTFDMGGSSSVEFIDGTTSHLLDIEKGL